MTEGPKRWPSEFTPDLVMEEPIGPLVRMAGIVSVSRGRFKSGQLFFAPASRDFLGPFFTKQSADPLQRASFPGLPDSGAEPEDLGCQPKAQYRARGSASRVPSGGPD